MRMPTNDCRHPWVRALALPALLAASTLAAAAAPEHAAPVSPASADAAVQPQGRAPAEPVDAAERERRARAYFGDHLLTDQDGRKHRFYSDLLSGNVVLINVVFTQCPSACPLMTERLKQVRRLLGDGFGDDIRFLSISIDPARDTPKALKEFAQRHGADEPGWRFLVADPTTLEALLGRLGQWSDSPESHTTLLIAGNAAKAHWTKLRPDAPPERIAADLERLKAP